MHLRTGLSILKPHSFIIEKSFYLSMIVFPIGVEPVKPSLRISGCSDMACPIEEPGPGKILITPGGKPALTASSANFRAVNGVTYKIEARLMSAYNNCMEGKPAII
jgi:hypothetical protein